MPISTSDAKQVILHRKEGNSLTPLHPYTNSEVVEYRCATADFDGNNTKSALDELFRRLGAIEGEMGSILPPLVAAPEILNPTSGYHITLDEPLEIKTSSFTMKRGEDTHTASEYRILGADKRQLWSSGESADKLESFPGLMVNSETMPGVAGEPDGESISVSIYPSLSMDTFSKLEATGGDGIFFYWDSFIYNNTRYLRELTRSTDVSTICERTAYEGAEIFTCLVWTGTRFLAFIQSNTSPSPVMASSDKGDSWTQVGSLPIKVEVFTRAAAKDGVIVVVSKDTTLYRSIDDGVTWNPVWCPVRAFNIMTTHGHFVCDYNSSTWVASRDGQFWFQVTALDGMTHVTADAEGLIGYRMLNGKLTLVRVVGENFQTTDKPATTFSFASDMSSAYCRLSYDDESGLYVLMLHSSQDNPDIWYGTSFPESSAESTLLSDAGWSGLSLRTIWPGAARPTSVDTLNFAGRDYFLCKMSSGGEDWPYKDGYMSLRVGLVGKLLSEQLFASARHKGQKADWSDWAIDVPFTAELGVGDAGETEGINQKNGVTFVTQQSISTTGNYLTSKFVVPDGVTELLILCASGVNGQPGWAGSCRVAVSPGQTIPIAVAGYDVTGKKVVTTSSVGGFISCDPATGVICPYGAIMQFQGAPGYPGTQYYRGGGFSFLTDDEWRNFALHGTDQQPTAANSSIGNGLNVGWNGFDYLPSYCGGYSSANGWAGIVKIWWGDQINE